MDAFFTSLGTHSQTFQVSDVPIDAQNAKILKLFKGMIAYFSAFVRKKLRPRNLRIPTASSVRHRANRSSTPYCGQVVKILHRNFKS